MSNPAINPAFCLFEDWQKHLPDQFRSLPLAAWMQKSRRGQWAGYSKILSTRSDPIWKKSEIAAWFEVSFASVYPTQVAALVAEFGELGSPMIADGPNKSVQGVPVGRKSLK